MDVQRTIPASIERLTTFCLPPPTHGQSDAQIESQKRRARLFLTVLALSAANLVFTSTVQASKGNHDFSFAMALILPTIAAFLLALRMGLSIDVLSHVLTALIYVVSLSVAISTGGQLAGGLFFLVLVPAVATLIVSRRAGIGWAFATLTTLVAIDVYSGPSGLTPWIKLDVADSTSANIRAAGLVLLAVTAVTYFFSSLEAQATEKLQRLVAIHQEGERRFRAITEYAYDLVAELDDHGRFVYASPGYEEILGWRPTELIGVQSRRRVHPDDRAKTGASWRILQEKGAVRQEPVRLITASGHSKWFEISMRSYSTARNEPRIVTVARDVSERIERDELLRSQHQLVAGGTMAAGAAHQLNNPLGAILAAAQYANQFKWSPNFGDLAGDSLDAIEEEAKRSGRILKSMLAFARSEDPERWVEDVKTVLYRAVRAVQSEERDSGVEIVMSLTSNTALARISPIEIEQAVINLVRNAIQAGASVVVVGLDITFDEKARISVSDDGPGLGEISPSSAFSPFFTTREGKGSGLGLAVALEIVRAHQGEIALTHSGNDGAVFRIDLPLAGEDS